MARQLQTIATGTAQSDVGQTSTVEPPPWARYMTVYLNVTASAGSTPLIDFDIDDVDPIDLTTDVDLFQWNGITQIAATGFVVIYAGPGITGIADDDTASVYKLNGPLPANMDFNLVFDRTTGDETYTYTLCVVWSD